MMSRPIGWSLLCLAFLAASAAPPARAAEDTKEIRLYALDCGRAKIKNMGFFSDTGEYDGKSGSIVAPCFLVRHPKGWLLWDTGLSEKTASSMKEGGIEMSVPVTLAEQLKRLGLAPADVTYVAFSHMHFDHTSNANEFGASTWILNRAELTWALGTPTPFGVMPDTFSNHKTAKTQVIDGDHDVFGDGRVRILKAPGHTPGHQVLRLRLKKAGVVILSGDLYHSRANRKFRRVPVFNYNRADTLASMDRIERIVSNTKARLIIQHDPADFRTLPKFPGYIN
jgi:glyoxylase-like metal-dependent hydrolase (beta-lactamase superfamily II)